MRPDRDGCSRDDFEKQWCREFVNVGQNLGVKIGRPLEQISIRGYEDFYNKIEGDWKKEKKDLCKSITLYIFYLLINLCLYYYF